MQPKHLPQIEKLCAAITHGTGTNLLGIYLHGSLAMGCFQPGRSDIDLLVVTHAPLSLATKRALIEDLLVISQTPLPIEISFVTREQLHPWQHPCPYDLHFSETHRVRLVRELADGSWRHWNDAAQCDADLAAHITVARVRGLVLAGQPIADVLPVIPATDYIASLRVDLADYAQLLAANPVYCVLNCCRILAYIHDGRILSKAEGGRYGQEHLLPRYHLVIAAALAAYQGEIADQALDQAACQAFLNFASAQLAP